jgi:glycosyltransferase involved in cell wall biosynthesis
VHNGVRGEEFVPVALAPDAADIVYLGELRNLKGVDVLIDAFARLRRDGRKLDARLVGDGAERDALQMQVARLGLNENVKFCGPLPTREALALGRLVALPSRAESLPYVVLEAAAAGKPIVTTKVGGIPEIFGRLSDGLVTPGNADELAHALAGALDRPAETVARANALRDRVASKFLAPTMVDSILGGYQDARMNPAAELADARARPGILT